MDNLRVLEFGCGNKFNKWLCNSKEGLVSELNLIFEDNINSEGISDVSVDCVDIMFEKSDIYCNTYMYSSDIFDFLENRSSRYGNYTHIYASRILEHISYERLHYLIYLLYLNSAPGAQFTFIVPDFNKISNTISDMDPRNHSAYKFNKSLIDVHTELFNTESDPHRSLWSPLFVGYWLELENYWVLDSTCKHITLDGRGWYLKCNATCNKRTIDERY